MFQKTYGQQPPMANSPQKLMSNSGHSPQWPNGHNMSLRLIILVTAPQWQISLGCGQMGSTLMGPLQSTDCLQIGNKKKALALLGKIKTGQREYPKSPSVKNMKCAVTPISAEPICPFLKFHPDSRPPGPRRAAGCRCLVIVVILASSSSSSSSSHNSFW